MEPILDETTFWFGRIEIATVAALLRNDISGLFEKTKPICQRAERRNLFSERNLWLYIGPRGTRKQSQFKANMPAFSRKS